MSYLRQAANPVFKPKTRVWGAGLLIPRSQVRSLPGPSGVCLAQRVDPSRRDEVTDTLQQTRVRAHKRALLELCERDVFGLVRSVEAELLRHLPCATPKHCVAEQADLQPVDVREPLAGDLDAE